MKTLTLRLPESLMASIEAEARERRTTKSAVVRRRLADAAKAPEVTDTWKVAEGILKEAWAAKAPARRVKYDNPNKQRILEAMQNEKQRRR